jgi:hypothetical protein
MYKDLKEIICKRTEKLDSQDATMFTEGRTYKIIKHESAWNGEWIWVIDDQGHSHGHYCTEDPEASRSYSRWFISLSDMRDRKIEEILT